MNVNRKFTKQIFESLIKSSCKDAKRWSFYLVVFNWQKGGKELLLNIFSYVSLTSLPPTHKNNTIATIVDSLFTHKYYTLFFNKISVKTPSNKNNLSHG